MSTTYRPAGAADLSAPLDPAPRRYESAAELCAAIRAAAEIAPEIRPEREFSDRVTRDRYPFKVPAEFAPGAYGFAPRRTDSRDDEAAGPGSKYPQLYVHPEAAGPLMPAPADARISFAYACGAARGSLTVANERAALVRLAEKVHAQRGAFDGKVRRPTKPAKPAGSAPHVAVRAMVKARDHSGALALAELRGRVFFGSGATPGEPHPYMTAEPFEATGHVFMIARSMHSGRFRVMHQRSGLSVDSVRSGAPDDYGFSSAAAALDWIETRAECDDFRSKLDAAAKRAPWFDQGGARAAFLAAGAPGTAELAEPAADGAPKTAPDAPAAADVPEARPAADRAPAGPDPAAPRHSFEMRLIGVDSQCIESRAFTCAGPGLTSADIAAANAELRAMAAARGRRVVSSGFGAGSARAWCEPVRPRDPWLDKPMRHVREVSAEEFERVAAAAAHPDRAISTGAPLTGQSESARPAPRAPRDVRMGRGDSIRCNDMRFSVGGASAAPTFERIE